MLDMTCQRKPGAPKESDDPDDLYIDHELKSSHLVWEPQGGQQKQYDALGTQPSAINPDIVLTKLRPEQGVKIQVHAIKGVGKDHAKFSPVGEFISLPAEVYLAF